MATGGRLPERPLDLRIEEHRATSRRPRGRAHRFRRGGQRPSPAARNEPGEGRRQLPMAGRLASASDSSSGDLGKVAGVLKVPRFSSTCACAEAEWCSSTLHGIRGASCGSIPSAPVSPCALREYRAPGRCWAPCATVWTKAGRTRVANPHPRWRVGESSSRQGPKCSRRQARGQHGSDPRRRTVVCTSGAATAAVGGGVTIEVAYPAGSMRPSEFTVRARIDGVEEVWSFANAPGGR